MADLLKSRAECDVIAEGAIAEYVSACGAHGDPDAIHKILELLISKSALAIVSTGGADLVPALLLRTLVSADEFRAMAPISGGFQ